MEPSFWHFILTGPSSSGVSQVAVSIIASSSPDAVKRDLTSKDSFLKKGINYYFKEQADAFATRDPNGAEILLAGLCALHHFGITKKAWTPVHPPAATRVTQPTSPPDYTFENGVSIWIIKEQSS